MHNLTDSTVCCCCCGAVALGGAGFWGLLLRHKTHCMLLLLRCFCRSVRRRVVVGEDGVMWRMQAGRRHKRYKKSKRRLLGLKGMVPLHGADAAKLRKLGYKKKWWFQIKA